MALFNTIQEDPKKREERLRQEKASEKVIVNRMLNTNLKVDNKSAAKAISSAAKRVGFDAGLLAGSSLQEGLNQAITDKELSYSEAYDMGGVDKKQFPIDGFYYYGLDTFSDAADKLKQKGYLPKDFKFQTFKGKNEKGQMVNTAAFRNNEDALVAKAAYMKDFEDGVKEYANKINLPLNKEMTNYLTLSAYNGGIGRAKVMIDELASGENPSIYIKEGKTSMKGIHKNIVPRLEKMDWYNQSQMFSEPRGGIFPFNSSLMNVYNK
jgi:hypothetical protein